MTLALANRPVTLDVGTTFLDHGIKDSPPVDRSTQKSLRLGYVDSF